MCPTTSHHRTQHNSLWQVYSACGNKLHVHNYCVYCKSPPPAPNPPSGLTASQNGLDSALVSWTAPSGGAAVTGYTIYYQQEGGERSSVSFGASATSATISGLIEGATYTITVTATSNTLSSITTAPTSLVIGTAKNHYSSHPHVMTKLLTNCSHSCGSVHLTRCHGNCW